MSNIRKRMRPPMAVEISTRWNAMVMRKPAISSITTCWGSVSSKIRWASVDTQTAKATKAIAAAA